jgi:cytochrome c biogenesis factor
VVLKDIPPSQVGAAEFRITFFPLMSWIWAGGTLMSVGGFLSLFFNKPKNKK